MKEHAWRRLAWELLMQSASFVLDGTTTVSPSTAAAEQAAKSFAGLGWLEQVDDKGWFVVTDIGREATDEQ